MKPSGPLWSLAAPLGCVCVGWVCLGGGIYPWFIVLVGCGIYPCFLGLVQVPPLGGVRGLPVSAVLYVAVRSASAPAPHPPPGWCHGWGVQSGFGYGIGKNFFSTTNFFSTQTFLFVVYSNFQTST